MKYKILFLLLLVIPSLTFGSGFAKYAGEFLYNGVGSRALAMGGAHVAVVNDATAGYWNPAGLMAAKGMQVHFMHARQFISSIQYDFAAVSNQFESGHVFALSMLRLGISNIKDSQNAGVFYENELIGIDESRIKNFNVADYAFTLSYARYYTGDIRIGANVKVIYRDFYKESALGLGFDAGLMYDWYENVRVGIMLRDITTTMMAWSTGTREFITPSVRTGISYRYDIDSFDLYLMPAVDLGVLLESRDSAAQINAGFLSMDSNWGMEIGYSNTIFLRIGYDDVERFNTGIGLEMSKIGFDYSYTSFDYELGNVHRISVKLNLDSI